MSEPGGRGGRRPGAGVSRARNSGRRKRRKNKVRATPFPSRLQHHHFHPLQSRSGENAGPISSPGPGEPTASRAAQYRQLRREALKTKVKPERKNVKLEKSTTSNNPTALRCEQWSLHKQKSPHLKTSSPHKTDKLQSASQPASSSATPSAKKPLASAENIPHINVNEETLCPENEREINYAGAKFSDPPSPSVLPKPPSHWMGINGQHSDQCKELMTYHLKTLLKVQA